MGQEESAPAERLLAAAETGAIDLALPSFSLSEPLVRLRRGVRDRNRLMEQLNSQVGQLARSSPHQAEVSALRVIPDLFANIEKREMDRLTGTVERLLASARLIELDLPTFRDATNYTTRYALEIEDAIIFSLVIADLKSRPAREHHLFANRNRKDFSDPGIVNELKNLDCEAMWSFAEAAIQLGVR